MDAKRLDASVATVVCRLIRDYHLVRDAQGDLLHAKTLTLGIINVA
jgi:hypothetical protein